MTFNSARLNNYLFFNDNFVKLYFSNGVIRYIKAQVFIDNFQDFIDLNFNQILKKYKSAIL